MAQFGGQEGASLERVSLGEFSSQDKALLIKLDRINKNEYLYASSTEGVDDHTR